MKALIFGINGQDGFYLNQILKQEKVEVIGVSRSNENWVKGSVADYNLVSNLIKEHQPNYIFHLAANSTTKHVALFENHDSISTGTLNILESVKLFSPNTRVFISGSGLQFKNVDKPIKETDEFEAKDSYSVSRIQSVYAARYYRSLGIKTYVGYFFNHDSPLRSERHVNQKIVAAVKRISNGSDEKIELGNINVKKEFTFAGDTAQAIWTLTKSDTVYETVIGSGKAYSIEEWLNICFGYFNLDWKSYVKINDSFKSEYNILVSEPSTLFDLGWKQQVEMDALAKMMIEFKNVEN